MKKKAVIILSLVLIIAILSIVAYSLSSQTKLPGKLFYTSKFSHNYKKDLFVLENGVVNNVPIGDYELLEVDIGINYNGYYCCAAKDASGYCVLICDNGLEKKALSIPFYPEEVAVYSDYCYIINSNSLYEIKLSTEDYSVIDSDIFGYFYLSSNGYIVYSKSNNELFIYKNDEKQLLSNSGTVCGWISGTQLLIRDITRDRDNSWDNCTYVFDVSNGLWNKTQEFNKVIGVAALSSDEKYVLFRMTDDTLSLFDKETSRYRKFSMNNADLSNMPFSLVWIVES